MSAFEEWNETHTTVLSGGDEVNLEWFEMALNKFGACVWQAATERAAKVAEDRAQVENGMNPAAYHTAKQIAAKIREGV